MLFAASRRCLLLAPGVKTWHRPVWKVSTTTHRCFVQITDMRSSGANTPCANVSIVAPSMVVYMHYVDINPARGCCSLVTPDKFVHIYKSPQISWSPYKITAFHTDSVYTQFSLHCSAKNNIWRNFSLSVASSGSIATDLHSPLRSHDE